MQPRPTDSLELLAWVQRQRRGLQRIEQLAIFNARLEGRFDQAVQVSGLSRKAALAATRRENRTRGKLIRWGSQ